MRHMGFDLEHSSSQLIPVLGGGDMRTTAVRDLLEEHGVFGSVFPPPGVLIPRSQS